MPNLHPLFTHFPIALLTVGFFVDVAALLLQKNQLQRTGWLLQLVGTVGLAATVVTGLIAKRTVFVADAGRSYFEAHEQIAFVVLSLTSVLLLWRISSRTQIPEKRKRVYFILCGAVVVLLWVGAWYGGEIVYGYGVGVKTITR